MQRPPVQTVRVARFGGMNLHPHERGPHQCLWAENVEFSAGHPRTRAGAQEYRSTAFAATSVLRMVHYLGPGFARYLVVFWENAGALSISILNGGTLVETLAVTLDSTLIEERPLSVAVVGDGIVFAGPVARPQVLRFLQDGTFKVRPLKARNRELADYVFADTDDAGPYETRARNAEFVIGHKERLYGFLGDLGWWSNLGDYDGHPAQNFAVFQDANPSDPIIGGAALRGDIVAFASRGIWVLRGDATTGGGAIIHRVVDGIGCVAPLSIQQIGGELYFLSHEGLMAFNGTSVRPVGGIEPLLVPGFDGYRPAVSVAGHTIDAGARWKAEAVHVPTRHRYLLAYAGDEDGGVNKHVACYDYRRGDWSVFTTLQAQAMAVHYEETDEPLWLTADTSHRVVLQDTGERDYRGGSYTTIPPSILRFHTLLREQKDVLRLRHVRLTLDDEAGREIRFRWGEGEPDTALTEVSVTVQTGTNYLGDSGVPASAGFVLGTDVLKLATAKETRTGIGPGGRGRGFTFEVANTTAANRWALVHAEFDLHPRARR